MTRFATQRLARDWSRQTVVGYLCAFAIVLLFSGFTLISRLGLTSSLSPLDLAAFRFGIGGLLMLPVLLHHGIAKVRWLDACALAFCGGLGFALFAYAGFARAPAAHGAALLHGTLPLFTFALGSVGGSRRVTQRTLLGLFVVLSGVGCMVLDSLSTSTSAQLLGDVLLLLASLCWSAYGVLASRSGLAPIHASSIVAVISMVAFIPAYLLLGGGGLLQHDWRDVVPQVIFQGFVVGVASIFIYTRAVAALGPLRTASFTSAVPVATTVTAVAMLHEALGLSALCGIALVTVGMVMLIRGSHQANNRHVQHTAE